MTLTLNEPTFKTKAITAANSYPWPVEKVLPDPVCASHDPELWFPDDTDDYEEAKRLCGTCPLAALCRDVAATRGEYGVWGGVLYKNGRPFTAMPKPGRPRKTTAAA